MSIPVALLFSFILLSSSLFAGPKIAFLKATLHGNTEEVRSYLMKDATLFLSLKDKKKNSPLHLACCARKGGEKKEIVNLLLAYGADVNARNNSLCTPLHIAVTSKNHTATAALLLSPSINPNLLDNCSYTPLHYAILLRSLPLIEKLLSCPSLNPNIATSDGATPLHCAAMWGMEKEAELLLMDPRIDPDAKQHLGPYEGATPLHFAALQAEEAIVRMLINRKVEINAVTSSGLFKGFTPLHFTVMNPDVPNVCNIVKLLLDAGANPKLRSSLGKRPIDLTKVYLVQSLLEKKKEKKKKKHLFSVSYPNQPS